MEDILASIRRIISEEDEPEAAAAQPEPAPKPAAAPPPKPDSALEPGDEDILTLTNMVAPGGKVVDLTQQSELASEGDIALVDEAAPSEPEPEAEPEPMPAQAQMRTNESFESDDGLISPETAAASTTALTSLAELLVREKLGSGRTIEDLIKELLRPLLKTWLDAHLAGLIERLVREEIEKMVNKARGL